MEQINQLNRYQKGLLLFLIAMIVVFYGLYSVTINKVGFAYHDEILVSSVEAGATIYAGKLYGETACFTVSDDKTVVFQYGDTTYGPYTAKEDPTAIPEGSNLASLMTGVEIYKGEDILFRGGVTVFDGDYWLYNQQGGTVNMAVTITSNGITTDGNGHEVDPMEPSALTVFKLMNDPELTHKGDWLAWFGGVILCGMAIGFMLFADELFRHKAQYLIRNADQAEPSENEIASRYFLWGLLTLSALGLFVTGLQW